MYWYCLELIAGKLHAKNITFELEHDSDLIAHDLRIDSKRVEEIMRYMVELELFTINPETSRIVCMKLLEKLDNISIRNPDIKMIVKGAKGTEEVRSSDVAHYTTLHNNTKRDKVHCRTDFKAPTLEEVKGYLYDRHPSIDVELESAKFHSYYTRNDWMVGRPAKKMSSWHMAMGGWIGRLKKPYVEPEEGVDFL